MCYKVIVLWTGLGDEKLIAGIDFIKVEINLKPGLHHNLREFVCHLRLWCMDRICDPADQSGKFLEG